MDYSARITRSDPAFILFMLDQSSSMAETAGGSSVSKAQMLADAVNTTLQNLLLVCSHARGLRHYVDVAVLGYSGQERAEPTLTNMLPEDSGGGFVIPITSLVEAQLRTDEVDSGMKPAIWVEPVADGWTPMCGALKLAGRIVTDWTKEHPRSFPPMIMNITDGAMTDGDGDELVHLGGLIHSVGTEDGGALLFDVHVSSANGNVGPKPDALVLPDCETVLPRGDAFARALWAASSELPAKLMPRVLSVGVAATPRSRLFAYNATGEILATMLDIGTPLEGAR
jgi:hypothetical protein